jgi:hypothetical protein
MAFILSGTMTASLGDRRNYHSYSIGSENNTAAGLINSIDHFTAPLIGRSRTS